MLDIFQSNTAKDFRQRYLGSYGYYIHPESKKQILVLMNDVADLRADFVDANGNAYHVQADSDIQFEFFSAKKRLFVYKDVLYYIRRRPARQWSRGISLGNTWLSKCSSQNGDESLVFAKILAAVEKTEYQPYIAVKQLEDKQCNAIVLSDQFGIEGGRLYLYNHFIGDFLPDRKEIRILEPLFKQEVTDLITKHFIPYKLV